MLPLLPQETSVLNRIFFFFFLSFSLFKYFRLRFSSMLLLPTSHTRLKFKDQVQEMLLLSNATFNATHLYRQIADKYWFLVLFAQCDQNWLCATVGSLSLPLHCIDDSEAIYSI